MTADRTYHKINQPYNWTPYLKQLESFPEFITQKELTEWKWPIQRLQAIFKPFQVGKYLVYKTEELKQALQNDLLNPSVFVLHPDYIDIMEISVMMGQLPHKAEIILNYYNKTPLYVHDTFHTLKIYDRETITAWWNLSKHVVNKNVFNIKGLQISVAPEDDKYLSDDLKKYKMTGAQAALYLGQTQAWMSHYSVRGL